MDTPVNDVQPMAADDTTTPAPDNGAEVEIDPVTGQPKKKDDQNGEVPADEGTAPEAAAPTTPVA